MSAASSRRLIIALAVSLGAHGLLWAWLEGATPVVRRPPPPRQSTVEWVEVEVAKAPGQPPAAQEPPSPPEATEPPRPPEPPPSPPEPPRVAERPPPVPEAPIPPATPEPPRVAESPPPEPPPQVAEATREDEPMKSLLDAPRAAPVDVPRADVPRADLFPSRDTPSAEPTGSRLLLAARAVTAPVDRGDAVVVLDGGVPDPRAPSAQELVQDLVSESVGRGKVDRGLVHPYFGQLGKALMKAWDADRSVKEHGLQGYFDMGMERGRAYSRIWMERAENYGSSGSFANKDAPVEDRRRPVSTVGDPSIRARREMRQQMREEFRSTRRAIIRVVQDGQGKLLDVQLVDPSHQPEVDKEAIKDVRAAAEKLPPPPPEAVGNRERIVSLWQFELIISISPPIPSFSFEFDEALGFIDTRMPLDRRIYKRVRLLEVR